MSKSINVPKLRFKEFSGEWVNTKLGNLGNFQGGGTPATSEDKYWIGNIPWISSSDLNENNIYDISISRFINEQAIKNSATKLIPNKILLIVSRVGVGKIAINNKPLCTSQDFKSLILKKDNHIFLAYKIKNEIQKLIACNQGTSIKGFVKEDLSNLQIPLPPLKEQEKIAEILTTWDEAITKQTELLRAKELLKIALMQKLLSGEVRFSGFSDEWEEVRLGEIGEFKTSSIDKIINENERLVNLINYMDVYRNKHIDKNFRCSKTSLKEEQYEKVNLKKGDILFTPSSETPDDIGHSAVIIEDLPNTVYSYHLVRFRPKKSIDLKFSGYVFNNIDILKEFAKRANGSTRFTLSIKDFNETKAKLPSLLEQHKIAEVLSLVDDEINLLKNELEELKLQKKALMQKLLTGEVRVKV